MTALQELIYFLHVNNNLEELNENLQVHDIMYKIHDLLAKEKQQIIDAYKQGHEDGFHFEGSVSDYESEGLEKHLVEKYYTDNYNQSNQ